MPNEIPESDAAALALQVARAQAGDRAALESVVTSIQKQVYALALRFLWHPQDAEDATQEILVRVITNIGSFRGESSVRTWVYRIACNTLLSLRQKRMETQTLSFAEFSEDLHRGLSDEPLVMQSDLDEALLLEEVKIGCTLAMLLCLDRDHRLAYILGEILELDHAEASHVLDISQDAYRKRLSRARADIVGVMQARCGLTNPANACRCRRRVKTAVALGRVDPTKLLFASATEQAKQFPQVLQEIRQLEETRRAAALYQSHPAHPAHPDPTLSNDFVEWLRHVVMTRISP